MKNNISLCRLAIHIYLRNGFQYDINICLYVKNQRVQMKCKDNSFLRLLMGSDKKRDDVVIIWEQVNFIPTKRKRTVTSFDFINWVSFRKGIENAFIL